MTQFDQLALPMHIPLGPSPARDGKDLRGRRAVQELRRDVPAVSLIVFTQPCTTKQEKTTASVSQA